MAIDPRIILWNPATTIIADGATNGPDVNLNDGYVSSGLDMGMSSQPGSVSFMIMAKNIVTGTGDGFTLTWKVQVAPDSSGSAGTYVDYATVGVMAFDTDGLPLKKNGTDLLTGLTRSILWGDVKQAKPWMRLVCTAAGITNGETADTYAYFADGAPGTPNDGTVY